ncbi:MAG: hypothetical protein LBP52_08320 [Burkholderiaceae bacterium]|nr:hypothetical protein [Burkholderiaceae bacterium]
MFIRIPGRCRPGGVCRAAFALALLLALVAHPAWGQRQGAASPAAAAPAIVMVLSPRMVYALQEWPRMKAAARAAGFDVTGVRDPQTPAGEWAQLGRVTFLTDLALIAPMSAALQADFARHGALNHMPSTLVYWCGKPHPWPVLGVMPDKPWINALQARATQLKQQPCAATR